MWCEGWGGCWAKVNAMFFENEFEWIPSEIKYNLLMLFCSASCEER